MQIPDGYIDASSLSKPLGMDVAFITPSVHDAHAKAVAAGVVELNTPETKPWGQVVLYVFGQNSIECLDARVYTV